MLALLNRTFVIYLQPHQSISAYVRLQHSYSCSRTTVCSRLNPQFPQWIDSGDIWLRQFGQHNRLIVVREGEVVGVARTLVGDLIDEETGTPVLVSYPHCVQPGPLHF